MPTVKRRRVCVMSRAENDRDKAGGRPDDAGPIMSHLIAAKSYPISSVAPQPTPGTNICASPFDGNEYKTMRSNFVVGIQRPATELSCCQGAREAGAGSMCCLAEWQEFGRWLPSFASKRPVFIQINAPLWIGSSCS